MMRNSLRTLAATTAVLASAAALAGGPLNTNANDPEGLERWPNGGTEIPYNIDQGGLGPLSPAEAVALVEGALMTWTSIPTASNAYVTTGQLIEDINETNFAPFVDNLFNGNNNADGLSPIVFDEDGAIFDALFGPGTGVLGFASTDTRDANGTPIEAVQFLNGGSILGGFPVADFAGVVFHEFGHYSGLGHTVVNGQNIALGDTSGPTPLNTYGNSPGIQTETMYPFALVGGGQIDPHADDIAFMSVLYPEPGFFAGSGAITGTIFAPDGVTPLTGVNVIARNVDNPFIDAVSAISGDRPGVGNAGTYTINGLTPGASYTVHVDQILQGGFSTTPITLPGPEEFHNDGESDNVTSPDDPADATEITVLAGGVASGKDVIFNAPAPGVGLDVGDDGFVELFLPFDFSICGQTFSSVFVNANGSLTFGAGDSTFTESAVAHLTGPPRIAGLFDDLNPSAGGAVTFSDNPSEFIVTWDGVPEFSFFGPGGSNTFSITLNAETGTFVQRRGRGGSTGLSSGFLDNTFSISYGGITAEDGIAGYSCGGAVSSGFERQLDLTTDNLARAIPRTTGVYELFSFLSPNDLAGQVLNLGSGTFADGYEGALRNDSPDTAFFLRRLPFSTDRRFSDITLADVDFYQFDAEAGEILTAEIVAGQLDTILIVLKLEDDGTLTFIDFNDDLDFPTNVLSGVQTPLAESGRYIVGVSTFPDFDFIGAGGSQGRYAINLSASTSIPLDLGDDDFEEVALPFSFPFQGEIYNSVFVNSNGSLTFGAGDTDFSESLNEFLDEQPRIAPLWDDLSPNQGGSISVDFSGGVVTVEYVDVPEFLAGNVNTFSVTLAPSGDISVAYGVVEANDGIAGITQGNFAGDPGPTDLSANPVQSNVGTTYEQFLGGGVDLAGQVISYIN
ncbi:MAG: carboxypeptidase-like regulatory domain-containing protein [Pseudomonadota bacterium]